MKSLYNFSIFRIISFSIFFILFSFQVNAQQTLKKGKQIPVLAPNQSMTFDDNSNPSIQENTSIPYATNRNIFESLVGTTIYDLQTNGTTMNRLSNYGNGQLSAVWTMGFEQGAYPDRGTGYNNSDGTDWSETPVERLEDVRTGWPSIVVTENETELIVAHNFATFELVQLRRESGETNWTQSLIPDNTPDGIAWPQMAVGGGESVHVIAISRLEGNDGALYNGVDGQILYYRSSDGGATWDITDFTIPGLDNTLYNQIRRADCYNIDAHGDVVAVTIHSWFGDVVMFKSMDAGLTWEKSIVYDFPFDFYEYDTGYTVDDLPNDPDAPDSLAIMCSDNSAAVLIDNNNQVHVFFGKMYVIDDNLTDDNFSYFPSSSGLLYWNESHGEDSLRMIADIIDANESDSIEIDFEQDNFGNYVTSLTSFPTVGIDDQNNIFLVYAGITENFFSEDANPNLQHYRHLYAMNSSDSGDSWSVPFDLINEDIIGSSELVGIIETVYPSMARKVDENIHLIYQRDFEPGVSINLDADPPAENSIYYIDWDKTALEIVGTKETENNAFDLTLFPNPANDLVQIELNLEETNTLNIQLIDLMGKQIYQFEKYFSSGKNQFDVDLKQIPSGIYFMHCQAGEKISVQKLIVQ